MALSPTSSRGSSGPANVSANTIIQTGSGSPYGSVTPTQIGALYQDLSNGTVYAAISTENTSWVVVGGYYAQSSADTATAGVGSATYSLGGKIGAVQYVLSGNPEVAAPAAGFVYIGDAYSNYNGFSLGFYWLPNGTDGQQVAKLLLGSTGQFTHKWNADGTYTLPAAATAATHAPRLNQLSPLATITSGALPTATLVSGTGAQISTSRDVETVTPVTFNPGVATTATCTVALSPDNTTYSTLGVETEPVGTVLDGTIHLVKVRVPAGWYLKLTVNAQAVLGTTTYY